MIAEFFEQPINKREIKISDTGRKDGFLFVIKNPINEKIRKHDKSIPTIVEPTGVPPTTEINKPEAEQTTEIIAEHIVTDLKLLKIRIALKAGKITRAEIKSDPTRFMASTIIIAIIIAITRL